MTRDVSGMQSDFERLTPYLPSNGSHVGYPDCNVVTRCRATRTRVSP